MKPRLLINIITPSPIAYKSWLMHRSRWWMNEWTDSDTSSGGTIYRHWRMYFERLLQAFARWQPSILLIVIHNRYSFAANDTLIHCLSSSDSTVHPEKSASWELPRNSFLTCLTMLLRPLACLNRHYCYCYFFRLHSIIKKCWYLAVMGWGGDRERGVGAIYIHEVVYRERFAC